MESQVLDGSPRFLLRLFGSPRLEGPDGPLSGPATQRHRLGLLALLALAPQARLPRDRLLGLLWPETERTNARHLLNAAAHSIRKALGDDALVTELEALRLDTNLLRIDVRDFEQALSRDDPQSAVQLYGGPFLDGLALPDAVEFEQWSERERDRLERLQHTALEKLAERAATRGDARDAVAWWRRRLALTPTDGRVALALMQALAAAGDRAGALQVAATHNALLNAEFGAEPDAQIVNLADSLRKSTSPPQPAPRSEPAFASSPIRSTKIDNASPTQSVPSPSRRLAGRRVLVPTAIVVLGVAALAAIFKPDRASNETNRAVRSIAVVPFVDNSPERDQEHFVSGIAEAILNALANVQGLSVPARSSSFQFRGDSLDVREVARRLAVDAVLEGSVQRVGDRLRIHVQLAHAGSGYQLFSKQYNGSAHDVFALQDEIAQGIVDELRLQLNGGPARPRLRSEPADLAAYELYLRGLQSATTRTREGLQSAVRYFEQALTIDSSFAAAHAGLADAYVALADYGLLAPDVALPRALQAVARALALDSTSAEAYTAQGHIWNEPGRWGDAERMFRRAIALRPSYAAAHMWLANNLMVRGQTSEGLQEFLRASELDPLSPSIAAGLSQALSVSGDRAGAIAAARRATEIKPDYPWGHATLASVLASAGQFDEARAEAERAVELSEQHPNALAALASIHARAGRLDDARAILLRLQSDRLAGTTHAARALIHANMGEIDEAFALLNELSSWNAASREWLRVNPVWQPLRADRRWSQLLRSMGLDN